MAADSKRGVIVIVKPSEYKTDRPKPAVDARKVLHLINGEHFAGAERVQDLLAMALPQFGYEITFACVKANRFPDVRQSDTPLHELKMQHKLDFRSYRHAARLVEEQNFELIHAHTPRSLMIGSMVANRTLN